jgi:aryl-phospho-beta-D-glucosidase BglC (GH1 family)
MIRTRIIALLILSSAALCQTDGVSQARFDHLRHGINASEWYAQRSNYSPDFLSTYTTRDDIVLMRRLGFDHVRLSIDPQPLWREGHADSLREEHLRRMDAVVDDMLAQDLAVIIDIHPSSEFKRRLVTDNREAVSQFADFWRALAQHYASRDSERIFLEVMNEPEFEDDARWYGVQGRLVDAIRQGAPKNTILVAGAKWSDLYDLLAMQPYADRNLIYNFHFYDPHIFTHQGATWGVNSWHHLHDIPYPSTLEAVRAVLSEATDPKSQYNLLQYGLDRWNTDRVRADMAFVADWAKRHKVRLTCNEFGVFREHSNAQSRAAWIRDVRTAFEENGIGWTMWDYRGGFGVVTKQPDGTSLPDTAIVNALGLKPAQK